MGSLCGSCAVKTVSVIVISSGFVVRRQKGEMFTTIESAVHVVHPIVILLPNIVLNSVHCFGTL
jgi:hypothetical protein